ncbi:hypothetical protein Tco_1452073 [Tanacetum coccineum]
MASQDARLSKFEADFKQHQSEMTNKIDTVLKAITDRIAGTLPSDTVKNPKLGTYPVLSARSYTIIFPQCLSHSSTSINAIKAHFNDAIIEPQQPEEPEPTLEDEFKDLHLNLPVLEVLAHAPIYNAILDKYVESKEEAPYWTTLRKRESYKPRPSMDEIGAKPTYYARKDFLDYHLPGEWEISRDAELNPFKDTLDQPPKNEDGAWHAKIRLIDPDGEEFTKTLQSIPTTRKLSAR